MIPELLAITPGDGRDLVPWIDAMVGAGLRAVLLRELKLSAPAYRALAERLRPKVELLMLHDAVSGARDAATALGAGLHVPGGRPSTAFPGVTSASCHTPAEVRACTATFALWSPVYAPLSKSHRGPVIGEEAFVALAAGRPVLALGGVDPERHRRLLARGVAGSAVIGSLFGAGSPAAAARAMADFQNRKISGS